MKTFSEITLGDNIIKLNKRGNLLEYTDSYYNKYPPNIVRNILVKSLYLQNNLVLVNGNTIRESEIEYNLNCLNFYIETNDYIYFSDFEYFKKYFRTFLRDRIFEMEEDIKSYEKKKLAEIKLIRKEYYDILN